MELKSSLAILFGISSLWAQDLSIQPKISILDTQTVEAIVKLPKLNLGTSSIRSSELKLIPSSLNDPMRALLALPGIESSNDISLLPYMRGGDYTETRVLWNQIPLSNPYHTLSMFSMFTMESIDHLDVHKGYQPTDAQGSLSGSISAYSRAKTDSTRNRISIDMMRSAISHQKNWGEHFFASASGQVFYYDYVQKGLVYGAALLSGDKAQLDAAKSSAKLLKLPVFADLNSTLRYKYNQGSVSLYSLWGGDRFYILDQGSTNTNIDSLKAADTLAWVNLNNFAQGLENIHHLNAQWTLQSNLGWQYNTWNANFLGASEASATDPTQFLSPQNRYNESKKSMHYKQQLEYQGDHWNWNGGISADYFRNDYQCNLNRTIYKLIVEGSPDPMDMIGQINSKGMIVKRDSILGLSDLTSTIRMDYNGYRDHTDFALFQQLTLNPSSADVLKLGLRLEHEWPTHVQLSPRAEWTHSLPQNLSLSMSSGIYTQRDFPFYYWAANPKLKSEKTWSSELGLEQKNRTWSWKSVFWGKSYWDLATTTVRSSLSNGFLFNASQFNAAKTLVINNLGSGYAMGHELSTEYKLKDFYQGRASAEIGISRRRDSSSSNSYPFHHFRDWKIKWFNDFKVAKDYGLAIRYQISKGFPYTGFERIDHGDTNMIIGPRLSRNYTPYQRLDLRFSKKGHWGKLPTESYFEIWNALNAPNAFLRDSKTKKLITSDLNMPIPFLFAGIEIQF